MVGIRIDKETQVQIDGLKQKALQKDTFKIYPFNPNFITDYKGYALGMSVAEIDRLHAFRAQNNYANSPEDFQQVTLISDSLLNVIAPYFKFPEWTQKSSKKYSVNSNAPREGLGEVSSVGSERSQKGVLSPERSQKGILFPERSQKGILFPERSQKGILFPERSQKGILFPERSRRGEVKDLNQATVDELRQISGIGEKLSFRIIKFRDRLGGFLVDEQLYDVYGLKPEVIERALRKFTVLKKPKIKKININTASEEELAKLIYIKYEAAQNIVEYRNNNGSITSFDELKEIEGFPSDKIERIVLYLRL